MNFLLWQLVDSAFPAGGFAHSGGLESSVHHGQIRDIAGVREFAGQTVAQAGRAALPLVNAAHRNSRVIGELDELCDAFLTNPVANRASRAQGRALLTSTARSFHHAGLDSLEARVRHEPLRGHHAPLFGAVLHLLGVDHVDTQRLFLFTTVRGVLSAAVRLGIVGVYEAQELQVMLADDIDLVIETCSDLEPFDISQTAPLIDLCQSTHDRLYSRLFQS